MDHSSDVMTAVAGSCARDRLLCAAQEWFSPQSSAEAAHSAWYGTLHKARGGVHTVKHLATLDSD